MYGRPVRLCLDPAVSAIGRRGTTRPALKCRLVRVEAGVVFYGMSPINRAVQLKEFIRWGSNVVIYRLEIEIVELQREGSLNERIVIEGNQNYGFFALPELLDITNQAGVVASMADHCNLRPPDCLLQVESDRG